MCDRHNTGCREHRGHSGFCFNRQGVGLCDPDCPPDHGYPDRNADRVDLAEAFKQDGFVVPQKGVSPMKRDNVSHYTVGEIECIDYIFDKLGYEGGMAYILGNLIKYSSRANHKGQRKSDVNKIRNYATIGLEKMAQYAPEEP
jgi:hypothetical protein